MNSVYRMLQDAWHAFLGVLLLFAFIFFASDSSFAAVEGAVGGDPVGGATYPVMHDSFFTDDSGNILMVVNIIGEVARPGQFVVRENVDFAKILALSGGLRPEANLKQVIVARQEPDDAGRQAYVVNLKSFYKTGDRSEFIVLKPNDTIIIPEKGLSLIKVARMTSIVYPFVNLYNILDDLN